MMALLAVRVEGSLLGPEILEDLIRGDLPGQKPEDFGLRRSLLDEIAGALALGRDHWGIFQRRLQSEAGEAGHLRTAQGWVIPFLSLLGYELNTRMLSHELDGLRLSISYWAGEPGEAPPIHIVEASQPLDRLPPRGTPRLTPHTLLQEFLNRTEHLWGLVTNGLTLRLLRNSTYLRRQAYVEFDLQKIFEGQSFQEFAILYRLLHRTRLPQRLSEAPHCWLENYYRLSLEQGGRVRERLRKSVEKCLMHLANGFLAHPANTELRKQVTDPNHSDYLSPEALYRQLLHLVYRFLFLLVSEGRGLISDYWVYRDHYGILRLRRLIDKRNAYTEHEDLWHSLRALWRVFASEKLAPHLQVSPLNSTLFEPIAFDEYLISNRDLLSAFWYLVYYEEEGTLRRVNYNALDVEELGSVYESLLDYHPRIEANEGKIAFYLVAGSERKGTGSYYTPAPLVEALTRSALDPVIEARLQGQKTPQEKEKALLGIRVCDPAAGSGHFLLAAARRLGRTLARIRASESEPTPEAIREATRNVITHCLYGVDKNPLAVELCRLALWIEGHNAGKPLTFLDHHIKVGDSLVGLIDLEPLFQGLPDEAFEPTRTDDKNAAKTLKKRNQTERRLLQSGQLRLPFEPEKALSHLSARRPFLEGIKDESPQKVQEKVKAYEGFMNDPARLRLWEAANLWTAAFFQAYPPHLSKPAITTRMVQEQLEGGLPSQALAQATALAETLHFFHWSLEFPEVFAQGGFDVVLSNPPWEVIQLEEQEFFANRDKSIAEAADGATRKRLIQALEHTNPALWQAYQQALHTTESTSRFLRGSGQYPLNSAGRLNTYSVFAERIAKLLRSTGRAGILLPTGIATDAANQHFFSTLLQNHQLISLFDFENRAGIFPAVHRSYKFCLLTLRGTAPSEKQSEIRFAFFLTHPDQLEEERRVFSLRAEDIQRLNPNTHTLAVFRSRQDAELTRAIYERVPILIRERPPINPWGVQFRQGLFNMTSDSHLFRTSGDLAGAGYRQVGNVYVGPQGDRYLPLYEAKMVWLYDHRYGSYAGMKGRSNTQLPKTTEVAHADPAFLVQPYYWVPEKEVTERLSHWKRPWLLGFRDVTNATNERTAIFSLIPRVGVSGCNLMLGEPSALYVALLLGQGNSIVFDYIARQKISGVHLTIFSAKQFPVLPPSVYGVEDWVYIVPRVMELVYVAWDMKGFADEVWEHADAELREAIGRQWAANQVGADQSSREMPEWMAEAYPDLWARCERGIPYGPFRWDAHRRTQIQAELDAYYARLYGLTRKQLRYILDPADLTERELKDILDPWKEVVDPLAPQDYAQRCKASTFHGETFRVLKEKELRQYGEYRTRRLILEAWDRLP